MAKSSKKPKRAASPGVDAEASLQRCESSADQRARASLAALDTASSERTQAATRERAAEKSSRLMAAGLIREGWDAADAARRLFALDAPHEADGLTPRPALDQAQLKELQAALGASLPKDYLDFCQRTGSARLGFGRRLGMRFIAADGLAEELGLQDEGWPGEGDWPVVETGGGELFLMARASGELRFLSLEGQSWPAAKSFAELIEKLIENRGELWWWLD